MGRRVFLLAIFLGMSVFAAPASVWAAPTPTPATCAQGDFAARLTCWTDAVKTASAKAPFTARLDAPLDATRLDPKALADAGQAFADGRFQLTVADKQTSGRGGSILLVLTPPTQRLLGPGTMISPLDKPAVDVLGKACDELCNRLAQGRSLTGDKLIAEGLAKQPVPPSKPPVSTSAAAKPPASDGGTPWTLISVLALVLLLGGGAVFLLRSRRPVPAVAGPVPYPVGHNAPAPPHRSRPVRVPPGPRRSATVRTDLHPQGYVEIDRCLYRAVWADSSTPPPTLGGSVDVVQGTGPESGMLIALPRTSPRSDHAP
jgi:hypothetical protein